MRARVVRVDDLSLGQFGGAEIPEIVSIQPVNVIPHDRLKNSAAAVDISAHLSALTGGERDRSSDDKTRMTFFLSSYAAADKGGRRPTITMNHGSIWLDEDNRCKHDALIVDYFNAYSLQVRALSHLAACLPALDTSAACRYTACAPALLGVLASHRSAAFRLAVQPGACWTNEVVYVDRAISSPWMDPANSVQHIEAALLFILAERDEMENCSIDVQIATFESAKAAQPSSKLVVVPCQMGGHAGMMDSCGLIGRYEDWRRMIDEMVVFLRDAL